MLNAVKLSKYGRASGGTTVFIHYKFASKTSGVDNMFEYGASLSFDIKMSDGKNVLC